MKTEREFFEKLPEIRKIMNENGIYFMNHSGWYEARDFKDFEYEQYINGAWYSWQARVPEGYVVVPKEPTQDQLEYGYRCGSKDAATIYRVMVVAESEK